jgi:hypothetical protein
MQDRIPGQLRGYLQTYPFGLDKRLVLPHIIPAEPANLAEFLRFGQEQPTSHNCACAVDL